MCNREDVEIQHQKDRGLQQYISKELTHFAGKDLMPNQDQQYQLLLKILKEGQLLPPGYPADGPPDRKQTHLDPFNIAEDPNHMINASMVCFCDIPVADMHIHMMKYGNFALSFLKSALVAKGANPVFYVAQNSFTFTYSFTSRDISGALSPIGAIRSSRLVAFVVMLFKYLAYEEQITKGDQSAEFDELRLFYDHEFWSFIKLFDASKEDSHKENFYMEREWRILGRLDFSIDDVHRIILPESYARKLRQDIPEYCGQVTFSDYL